MKKIKNEFLGFFVSILVEVSSTNKRREIFFFVTEVNKRKHISSTVRTSKKKKESANQQGFHSGQKCLENEKLIKIALICEMCCASICTVSNNAIHCLIAFSMINVNVNAKAIANYCTTRQFLPYLPGLH
jgi:hypothetical protein